MMENECKRIHVSWKKILRRRRTTTTTTTTTTTKNALVAGDGPASAVAVVCWGTPTSRKSLRHFITIDFLI
jgi:hypothetical protein